MEVDDNADAAVDAQRSDDQPERQVGNKINSHAPQLITSSSIK